MRPEILRAYLVQGARMATVPSAMAPIFRLAQSPGREQVADLNQHFVRGGPFC